jgi:hypothetical protein
MILCPKIKDKWQPDSALNCTHAAMAMLGEEIVVFLWQIILTGCNIISCFDRHDVDPAAVFGTPNLDVHFCSPRFPPPSPV